MMENSKNKRLSRRLLIIFLSVVLVGGPFVTPFMSSHAVYAETDQSSDEENTEENQLSFSESDLELEDYYYDVLQEWEDAGIPLGTDSVAFQASDFVRTSDDAEVSIGAYGGKDDVLLWPEQNGWVEYEVEVPREGLYEITVENLPFMQDDGGSRTAAIITAEVNGGYPFREARSMSLRRAFRDQDDQFDDEGNQIRSLIDELTEWETEALRHSGGSYVEPLLWHLEEGKNTIRIQSLMQPVALNTFTIRPKTEIPSYEEARQQYPSDASPAEETIELEAEEFTQKNSTSIQVQYDRDALTTPKSLERILFNTLGGESWFEGGQAVTWEFDVPEDGLYKISFRALQNFRTNLAVYRSVFINGEVPFDDLINYQIPYASRWQEVTLADEEGTAYEFYLEKGKNTIKLEATYEPFVPLLIDIDEVSLEIRSLLQKLRIATGDRNDEFRVWNVNEELPGVIERFETLSAKYKAMAQQMIDINRMTSNVSQSFESSAEDIDRLLRKPNEIPSNQIMIGSLEERLETQRQDLMNGPLQLDKVYAAPVDQEFPRMTANMFERLGSTFSGLIYSFTNTNQLRSQKDDELNVWMMWGRDYAEELQQLADQRFTPEYGIKVNVNVIQDQNLLIMAKAAGIMPDLAMGIPSGMPFEMALRGAAKDISEMPGADEVLSQYAPGALYPYYYDGGYYGVPETINFRVMFYRKDILAQLGLDAPQTWQDVYDMVPTLLQNQYNFYADPKDFSYMLFQNGVDLYTEDGLSTGLNKPEGSEPLMSGQICLTCTEWIDR